MSNRVAADLESMIAFREHLIRFNRTLAEEFASMEAHWRSLGDVWTDVPSTTSSARRSRRPPRA
jgi:hypothetical protein